MSFRLFSCYSSYFPSCCPSGAFLSMTSSLSAWVRAWWPMVHFRCNYSMTCFQKKKKKKRGHSVENFMQGCWVMDCNRCVFLSHQSTRCQSLNSKQTQRTAPPIQDRILQQLDLGITEDWNVVFPFPQMNRCPIGADAAARPAARYQAGTSWKGVSFRIRQGPQLWLKSRRTPERNSS